MTITNLNCLHQLATYLKVPVGKISLNSNSMPTRTTNNVTTTGFIAIIFELLKQANSPLNATSLENRAELRQWLEYVVVYVLSSDTSQNYTQILKELNGILSTRTYLVSQNLTVADVVVFYALHNVIANLSYMEKEKYLNLSRWFDNLQQNATLRQKNKIVDFNTNYLASMIPIRH